MDFSGKLIILILDDVIISLRSHYVFYLFVLLSCMVFSYWQIAMYYATFTICMLSDKEGSLLTYAPLPYLATRKFTATGAMMNSYPTLYLNWVVHDRTLYLHVQDGGDSSDYGDRQRTPVRDGMGGATGFDPQQSSASGSVQIGPLHVEVKQGDITRERVGAIVNCTTETLYTGGTRQSIDALWSGAPFRE